MRSLFAWRRNFRRLCLRAELLGVGEGVEEEIVSLSCVSKRSLDLHLLSRDWNVHIQHVLREANALANCLAGLEAYL